MKKILLVAFCLMMYSINYAQTSTATPEEQSNLLVEQGNSKADNNDWMGALNDYTSAIGFNGKNYAAFYHRGLAKQNLKDYRGAIMDFSKAVYLNNADGASYYGRGICYYMLGMKEKCCMDLSKGSSFGNADASQAIQNYCN